MKIIKWRVATSCKFVMSKNSAKHQLVNETLELETETIKIRSGDRRDVETDTSFLVHGRDRTVRTWSSTREDHDRRGLTALDYTAQGNGVLMYSVCGRCELAIEGEMSTKGWCNLFLLNVQARNQGVGAGGRPPSVNKRGKRSVSFRRRRKVNSANSNKFGQWIFIRWL